MVSGSKKNDLLFEASLKNTYDFAKGTSSTKKETGIKI